MASNTVDCPVCSKGPFDRPNDLWSHIRMSARHEDQGGDHIQFWNNSEKSETDNSSDKLEEMKQVAQEEKEKDVQMVETPEKPADEPDYRKIREINEEEIDEETKDMLLKAVRNGYTEIEDDDSKPWSERDTR